MDLALVAGSAWGNGDARRNDKHGVAASAAEQMFFGQPPSMQRASKHGQAEWRFFAQGMTHATHTPKSGAAHGGDALGSERFARKSWWLRDGMQCGGKPGRLAGCGNREPGGCSMNGRNRGLSLALLVVEDRARTVWVLMLDWDMHWMDACRGTAFDPGLRAQGIERRAMLEDIMHAAANGEP